MNQKQSILLSIGAVIIMLVLYFASERGMFGDNPVGQTGSYNEPLVVPAGYAFAIWGIIYLGIIALPIYHWIKRQEGHELWIPFRYWFSLNVICNGLWLAFASMDWLWTTVGIILVMLVSLYQMRILLKRMQVDEVQLSYWFEQFVVHIYFAWITLATALNISAALNFYQWSGFGISELTWALIILPIAAIIAGLVFRKFRDRAYALVVVWAFVALFIKHIDSYPSIAYLGVAVVVIFSVIAILGNRKPELAEMG